MTEVEKLREALKAGLALLPGLREDVAEMKRAPLWPQSTAIHRNTLETIISALEAAEAYAVLEAPVEVGDWSLGDRVEKKYGSNWRGKIVGFYSTKLTPVGYAVESENEPGSVQIYPKEALAALPSAPVPGFVTVPVDRNAVLEEAAKLADALAWRNKNTGMLGPEQNCVRVAAAIRALASPASGTGGT